ncbi:unnamed protein product [Mytilus edulis]|uniref:Uncharacterized protein n=1 Tax=Mytilus edulis TaxID=6550 RepID=A0A8S3PYM8_MYTED|nr:unnamed protein product [Mytilus edulis]
MCIKDAFTDFLWMSELDDMKGVDIRQIYRNDKQVVTFVNFIAKKVESQEVVHYINENKLKEEGTTDKENIKDEEYELTIQDDTFSVSDELKVLEGELEEVEQLEASMRAGVSPFRQIQKRGESDKENKMTMQYRNKTFGVSDELKELEAEVEASIRAGKTLKNVGDIFKDTGLNCKLNGGLGKEMKKEERRLKKKTEKRGEKTKEIR